MTPTGRCEERSKCKRLMGTATFSIITKPGFRNGSESGRTSQCHLSNQIIVPQFGGNWRALRLNGMTAPGRRAEALSEIGSFRFCPLSSHLVLQANKSHGRSGTAYGVAR